MLPSVDEVSLRCVGRIAYARVPERLAIGGVQRHKVSATIAGENDSARGRQQPAAAAARKRMAPGNSPGPYIFGTGKVNRLSPAIIEGKTQDRKRW